MRKMSQTIELDQKTVATLLGMIVDILDECQSIDLQDELDNLHYTEKWNKMMHVVDYLRNN